MTAQGEQGYERIKEIEVVKSARECGLASEKHIGRMETKEFDEMADVRTNQVDRTLHVVYASDDKFAEILGVSLTSLYENNKEMEQINIYVLDSGITASNKAKLNSLSEKYGRAPIQWLEAKNISEELQMDVAIDRGSLSQYARLFVSSVLPSSFKRVLYLDCDIIITKSLEELWNLDMHGKTIAALKDAFSKWYRMNIDLKPNDIMFNSGVMLIDLDKWKEQKVEEKLMKFISDKKGKIQQGDQGALNAVLTNDTYCFDPRFNSVTIFYDFNYKEMMKYRKPPKGFYTEEQIKEREAIMAKALVTASEAPLSMMELILEAMKLIDRISVIGSRIAISDAGVGITMCEAAMKGASLNVFINTKLMKDRELADDMNFKADKLLAQAAQIEEETFGRVMDAVRP